MGEQSYAWRIVLRNDRKSRHRRIKKQRRYDTLGCHKPVIPVVTFLTPLTRKLYNSKGSISHAFAVCIRTENQDQVSFYLFALQEVSVLFELALGHLRYSLTDVPPQSNSPPDTVIDAGRPLAERAALTPKTKTKIVQSRFIE